MRLTTGAVLLLGLWLRARGFLFSTQSLWLDEATWAIRLMDKPLVDNLIRPLGFMALAKWLSLAFGPSETVLRLMPWCAGVTTLLMAPALSRRLFRSAAARLLFVSVIALHPGVIDLSKEFKPYSVGLAMHAGMLLLALRYSDDGKFRDLAGALGLAVVAVLFAQDAVFAYPGLFLVLVLSAFRRRRFRHLISIVVMGSITLALVAGLYVYIWSRLNQTKEARYWGKKYDVFYVPSKNGQDRMDWTAARYANLVAVPGSRRDLWRSSRYSTERIAELRSFDGILWLMLHVAGLTVMVRGRRLREALLLVMPLLLTTAFNLLGFWPLGEFRTNLFVLVYAAGIACLGIDRDAKSTRWEDLLPALALVFAPLFTFERDWHSTKQMYTVTNDFPTALKTLIHLQGNDYSGPREKLVVDLWSCTPVRYYMRYHPTYRETIGSTLRQHIDLVCRGNRGRDVLAGVRRALGQAPRVWLLATSGRVMDELERGWPDDFQKSALARIGDEHLVVGVTEKSVAPVPAPAAEPATEPDADGQGTSDD